MTLNLVILSFIDLAYSTPFSPTIERWMRKLAEHFQYLMITVSCLQSDYTVLFAPTLLSLQEETIYYTDSASYLYFLELQTYNLLNSALKKIFVENKRKINILMHSCPKIIIIIIMHKSSLLARTA